MAAEYETKWLDPDFRTKGSGPHCVMCARSLKSEGGKCEVRYFLDEYEAIPVSEWDRMTPSKTAFDYELDGNLVEVDYVGSTCAKKLGEGWSN
ncbi:hypothetical protein [Erythrobacter aureus]|uniref:Uncharacterized protein n=1 Tax=Erythrobacter aureus TaxID=2182384 RepID=A0A345YJA0_9SPHN|nr:hypothetical protein [Erythrobacter aureus]AXK44002.1 hypothetical protein DVR09_16240 [Erythrobacter aureus]